MSFRPDSSQLGTEPGEAALCLEQMEEGPAPPQNRLRVLALCHRECPGQKPDSRHPRSPWTGNPWDPRSQGLGPAARPHGPLERCKEPASDFPGTPSKRLKVGREGLPLGTSTFPGFTDFQGSLFLEQWSQLLPRPGPAHWPEDSAEPPPLTKTPWRLGVQPGGPG